LGFVLKDVIGELVALNDLHSGKIIIKLDVELIKILINDQKLLNVN
jgi:hypothetical protein